MSTNPFAILADDLRWLEAAMERIIDDYEASSTTKKWPLYWQRENWVRAAERSVRRSMKVYHCVFGPGKTCADRLVSNCEACVPRDSTPVTVLKSITGRAQDGSRWDVDTLAL